MSDKVFYSEGQIRGNIHRTLKANLLTYLPEEILDNLTDKYFRDKEGNLLCAYTGEILDNESNILELEHIIPVSNGGGTILFNVVPSLREINRAGEKWDNNLLDWWKNSKYFDITRLENIVSYMLEGYEYCAKQDGLFAFEIKDYEEEDDIIKDEEYFDEMQKDVEEKEAIKKHDINTYKTFLNSLIIELENNKIDVSSFLERIKNLEKENVFEELDEQVMYQKVMLSLMRKYANNSKYKISSEVDYKKIIHNLGLDNIKDNFEVRLENFVMTLNEEKKVPISVRESNEKLVNKMDKNTNTFIDKSNKLLYKIKNNKKVKDEDILKYELEKQIIKVFKKTSNKISFNSMMEYIIKYPEILYDDNFDFDALIKEHYKKYDKYADIIIGFCNEYKLFPKCAGNKEFQGKTEKTIYIYYRSHKYNFRKEKQEEVEKMRELYQDLRGKKKTKDQIESYSKLIIGFCNEHKKFPSGIGKEIYHEVKESSIYEYYKRYRNMFSDKDQNEIERLRMLYFNKKGPKEKNTNKLSQEQYDNYADIIIGFCNEYKQFPSAYGIKKYQGKSEKTIYGYYYNHKDNFSQEKRDVIKRLKNLYQIKPGEQNKLCQEQYDNYADIIMGFCNEYKQFPSSYGIKKYLGISEKTIYGYYKTHKYNFFKEKLEEIERLKDLYQNISNKEKTLDKLGNYADIIIGFCNEYKKFPSRSGTKEYQGKSEIAINALYNRCKDKFSQEKRDEIERLKKLYPNKGGRQTFSQEQYDNYANLIIKFCKVYKKFPSIIGTKEYQGRSEKTIYGYYRNYKNKFQKEKIEEIENLRELYSDKLNHRLSQEELDEYADLIITFCNKYKLFPRNEGDKEYGGKGEQTLYGYYERYKNRFSKEKQEEIKSLKDLYQSKISKKKTDDDLQNYADLIIGFCNEYQQFPNLHKTRKYQGISEMTLYGYYRSHKNKFPKEKRDEIERLKGLYQNPRGIPITYNQLDEYANLIIEFCNEYKKFPSSGVGKEEYEGISEKTLYNYYYVHKNKFPKEKLEEIESLKDLYQSKKDRKKVINVENKLDNTKGKGR